MPILMPEEQSYELMPPGSHVATCFRICDVGTQPGQYGPKSQIVISWETPDELMADGRPFLLVAAIRFPADARRHCVTMSKAGWGAC